MSNPLSNVLSLLTKKEEDQRVKEEAQIRTAAESRQYRRELLAKAATGDVRASDELFDLYDKNDDLSSDADSYRASVAYNDLDKIRIDCMARQLENAGQLKTVSNQIGSAGRSLEEAQRDYKQSFPRTSADIDPATEEFFEINGAVSQLESMKRHHIRVAEDLATELSNVKSRMDNSPVMVDPESLAEPPLNFATFDTPNPVQIDTPEQAAKRSQTASFQRMRDAEAVERGRRRNETTEIYRQCHVEADEALRKFGSDSPPFIESRRNLLNAVVQCEKLDMELDPNLARIAEQKRDSWAESEKLTPFDEIRDRTMKSDEPFVSEFEQTVASPVEMKRVW